ncbi:phosphotransferase family protein [Gordonia sp. CPCC 205333]|uniref:phosphotransferase family protein n=1 Tax=Gordonia sp. CPCC 205333 TaxID=3140790 RepID=UPI003AF3C534
MPNDVENPSDIVNADELARPSSSRRDPELLREAITAWLATKVDGDAWVTDVQIPSANGMSSETILIDADWAGRSHHLVARIAPQPDSDPVFPHYDLDRQFRVIAHVAAATDVPVPALYWSEPEPGFLGAPFFVMGRVEGEIPPDVMPYTFGSWVGDASDEQRALLQTETIRVLAQIHQCPVPGGLDMPHGDETPLQAHIRRLREFYEWTIKGRNGSPLIDHGLTWVADNLPEESDAVLTWGDARIGNVIYTDFQPSAVLDWEMAAYGPRELDIAWLIFLHRFFQDLAESAGMPGLPGLLRREDVAEEYAKISGHHPQDLDFYTTYAALIHAVVMFRIQCRAIDFGQAHAPFDPDDMILHRATLEAMLAGTYWENVK